MMGKIAFYHERKQYGFVESPKIEEDAFFHLEDIKNLTDLSVEEGREVFFKMENDDKGPRVVDMKLRPVCQSCDDIKIHHDRLSRWFCPFCEEI